MTRKLTAKRGPDTIPTWLSLKIRDAGASAYAWGESELLDRIDPGHKLQNLNDAVNRTGIVATSALLAALSFSLNTTSGLITAVILAAGLVHTGARRWSTLTLGTVLVAMWPLRSEPLGILSLALLAGLGALAYVQARGSRTAAATASTGAFAVSSAGMPELLPVVLLMAATGALVAAGIIRPKLGNDVPFLRPGPPPTTIPWLVRALKRNDIKHVPDDIRRKTLGAEGERATALRLMGLQGHSLLGIRTRAKALAVHDIASLDTSKTRANLDHLVLTTGGLFVLDTKVFAAGSTVAVSTDTQDVLVLSTGGQSKSILPLMEALVKECVATRDALSQETMGFLVVHGARVPRGISVRFAQDAVTVEVIDQKDLIGRLDAPRRGEISKREFTSLARAIRNIPSASGGRSTPVRPLRLTFANRPRIAAPSMPALVLQGTPAAEGRQEAAVQPAQPSGTVAGKWDAMLTSPPAPADLVDLDMRDLARGRQFEVFSIAEDLSSVSMFAVTGPCQAEDGSIYVWATDGPNWAAFMQTNRPVAITKVPLGQIILTSPANP